MRIATALVLAVAFALGCSAGTYAYLDARADHHHSQARVDDGAHREIALAHRVAR